MNDIVTIPIDRLVPDESYQPRINGLSERHVQLLTATDPANWRPLLVTPTEDGDFALIDGFHRYEAARRLGLPALACRIDPNAGYLSAVVANMTHGLPLSMADRKDAVRWLAEQDPELSYRELGRRVGLHHETVKRALDAEEGPTPRTPPDPVARFVTQVLRLADSGHLRAGALKREIAAYNAESQEGIAAALDRAGRACVATAAPYLGDD